MTDQFSDRHDIQQQLTSLVTDGVIVEIGVGFGFGMLAMDKGNVNHIPLYGIDPYLPYVDPLGGTYGETTRQEMLTNTTGVNFTHIAQPCLDVVKDWDKPIGMLWVDLSMPYDKLKVIFDAWFPHVIKGGFVAFTGLCYPDQLGTRQLVDELTANCPDLSRFWGDNTLVGVLRREVKREPKRAAFFIANGARYEEEARLSAKSVRQWLGIPSFLFIVHKNDGNGFDGTNQLPPPKFEGWYRNQVWYFNQAVEALSGYDQLLYMDTDTLLCRNCSGIWQILEHYDMAMGHAAGRGATPTAVNCPSEFATLGIGVEFFNNTPKVRRFFADWQVQFEKEYPTYGETDEGPFRDLLFLNRHNIKYFVLAPEEHCRFGFGVWLNGAVSILHGRVDTPLPEIATEINSETSMRLYRYGGKGAKNMLWFHK